MDIFILLSWKTRFHQRAWAIEECGYCQGLEPTRVEEKIWTFSIYFFPIIQDSKGWIGRCDFCNRPITATAASRSVPLEEWSPDQGLAPLFRKLGYKGKVVVRRAPVDERLRSLLSAAQDATSINQMDVTFGITTGALLGAVLGGLLGYVASQVQIDAKEPDVFRFAFVGILAGLVLGLIGGALTQWLMRRSAVAAKLIHSACTYHGADIGRLEELSSEFNQTVQVAVADMRDELSLGG